MVAIKLHRYTPTGRYRLIINRDKMGFHPDKASYFIWFFGLYKEGATFIF